MWVGTVGGRGTLLGQARLPPRRPRDRPGGGRGRAGQGLPLGLETLCFSGEGRSVWVTVHVNLSPDSQSSTQTEASPLAPKVPLA